MTLAAARIVNAMVTPENVLDWSWTGMPQLVLISCVAAGNRRGQANSSMGNGSAILTEGFLGSA